MPRFRRRPQLAGMALLAGLAAAAASLSTPRAQSDRAPDTPADQAGETAAFEIPEIVGDQDLGERLFMRGIGADGAPVEAIAQGDLRIDGTQMTCASCHRASGMGSSEGGAYVPPITAGHLFSARRLDRALRNERFKEYYKEAQDIRFEEDVRKPRLRPAYTEETLAKAIRRGVDPADRPLNPTMPRYTLSDTDMSNLLAFLTTLSPDWDPGVDDRTIHFATIVSEDIPAERARAMTDTMWVFAEWMNKDTETDLGQPGFSPYYRSEFVESYRLWQMHGWTLRGKPESWRAQLEDYYEDQPVFAVLGGLVDGPFEPVARFCNAHKVPCLFPHTELPEGGAAEGGYAIYFSRGVALEAEVLAAHLANHSEPPATVLQIAAAGAYGTTPAEAFAAAMAARLPETAVETRTADSPDAMRAEIAAALAEGSADALAIWPGPRGSEAAVEALKSVDLRGPAIIALPSHALAAAQTAWPADPPAALRVLWRYDEPTAVHPDSYRARAWLRTRRIAIRDWDLQRKTFFTMKMVQFSLDHMLSDFHRSYMMEIIEHEVENAYDTGPYRHLSLGPGQRFASKGAFVVALAPDAEDGIEPVSEWIVP